MTDTAQPFNMVYGTLYASALSGDRILVESRSDRHAEPQHSPLTVNGIEYDVRVAVEKLDGPKIAGSTRYAAFKSPSDTWGMSWDTYGISRHGDPFNDPTDNAKRKIAVAACSVAEEFANTFPESVTDADRAARDQYAATCAEDAELLRAVADTYDGIGFAVQGGHVSIEDGIDWKRYLVNCHVASHGPREVNAKIAKARGARE